MNKLDVIEFFNNYAPSWDENIIVNKEIINTILDKAGVQAGSTVLDVACGTGVLFPFYEERNVASVVGIDIAPAMIDIAQNKIIKEEYKSVTAVCGDVENYPFDRKFDAIVIYNAFPHFPNPEKLIERLPSLLKAGGTLTVAHGMSRKALSKHHSGSASKVSIELLHEDALAELMSKCFNVETVISNEVMYQVTGIKL